MNVSALAKARAALSIVAWKKGHWRYISYTVCQSVELPSNSSTKAAPRPYHAGIKQRFCVHENTHGIARRSASVRSPRRRAGRDPIFKLSISSIGVADPKNSMKPG